MDRDNKFLAILATVCATLCALLIFMAFHILKTSGRSESETIYKREYIYVNASTELPMTEATIKDESVWIVKEHFGQIGIFTEDGTLLRTIEIYTKTLPETDRMLLKEGIRIVTKESLYSLIEDYSS